MTEQMPELWDQKKVSSLLGISERTLFRWVHEGAFPPPVQMRRFIRWSPRQITAFIESKIQESTNQLSSMRDRR